MANDTNRVSQLGVVTTVSANDRFLIVTSPGTSTAATQTITVNNFIAAALNVSTVSTANNSLNLGGFAANQYAYANSVLTVNNSLSLGGFAANQYAFANSVTTANNSLNLGGFAANQYAFANSVTTNSTVRDAGTTTAVTINFSTDQIVLFNPTSVSTITLANPIPGKKVELWVRSGTTNTITHGVQANQSTGASATFTPASGASYRFTYLSTTSANSGVYVNIN
jgi:hypothetical protein